MQRDEHQTPALPLPEVTIPEPIQRESSMARIAFRALALVIVIPTLVILYAFRNELRGKEVVLSLSLVLAGMGFYLMWRIIKAISTIQTGLRDISSGNADSVNLQRGPAQLQEMAGIINALNRLTADFRENASQLENFIQQFATLAELTEITARVPDIHELLCVVLKRAVTGAHARRGTIILRSEAADELELIATEGWVPEKMGPISMNDSLAGRVIRSGEALLIEDVNNAADIPNENDASCYNSPSFLILPLKAKSEVVGAVCLAEKATGTAFNRQDQQFLTVMLGQVGFAIQNARLLKQAREAARDLKQTVKNQEIEIQHAQGRIVQAEKLSALGQLAGGVAHDFNNILQVVLSYTKLVQESIPEKEQQHGDLEQVRKAAEKAAALTAQLLAFGRRQVLQPADIDVNHVIDDLMMMLQRVIGEHIQVEFEQGESLDTVNADPTQIEQVLVNLCINARDAMPSGGKIAIRTENVTLDESHVGIDPGPGRYVSLAVTDDGSGMDESTLEQIFEPFFTTKDVGKGTGLGLATVYGIVKQHGGTIEVASEVDRGTTFNILLPIVDRPAINLERHVDGPSRGGDEVILVAEDETTVRELNVRILEKAGYTVIAASDGSEAVTLFEENEERIHLALLDAVMPKKSGQEVYIRIRERQPEMPVVFSSGYSGDAANTGFVEDAGLPFIQKPYGPDELLSIVRRTLDENLVNAS